MIKKLVGKLRASTNLMQTIRVPQTLNPSTEFNMQNRDCQSLMSCSSVFIDTFPSLGYIRSHGPVQ
jgi:hypothetical protein